MSKSIQLKNNNNEKMYPHPYYPVGSIYLSVNDINPSKWFGGTWEQIAKGRTLVGVDTSQTEFNTVKKIGGEKEVKLTTGNYAWNNYLTNAPIPEVGGSIIDTGWNSTSAYYGIQARYGGTNVNIPHNNLPPYFTCYIWCRIA